MKIVPVRKILLAVQAIGILVMCAANVATAKIPEFKLSNPQVGHQTEFMGLATALDGTTLIVGASYTDTAGGSSAGTVRVYVSDGSGGWNLQAELTASDGAGGDFFGNAVAISGNTAIIGAYKNDEKGTYAGAAYVFTRSGTVWTQQAKLTADDGGPSDMFGNAVGISADTVLVGAASDAVTGTASGSAYVFVRTGSAWAQQAKIISSDSAAGDYFGGSVCVSGDTAIIGAASDDDAGGSSGSAYVFTRNGSAWAQQQKLIPSFSAANDHFGGSVSISGDTAVIGAYGDDGRGSAFVFTRSGLDWTEQSKLTASDAAADDYFGESVSISGDTVLVGAGRNDDAGSNSGSAYAFVSSGGVWTQQAKLLPADIESDENFGRSVCISGGIALMAAPYDDDSGEYSGAAYVYARNGSSWSQQKKLISFPFASMDYFGYSVSISGDTALVGVYRDNDKDTSAGSAYVFARTGSVWNKQAKLFASDAAYADYFGASVVVSGNTAAVGATGEDDVIPMNSGAVYVFTRSGSTWTQQAKLRASDPGESDDFGTCLSLSASGDTLIVGASKNDDKGTDSGSAYIFTRSGTVWSQQAKLVPADGAAYDGFGKSVSISSDTAVVGASVDDDRGSAYVYTRSGTTWSLQTKLTASDATLGDRFGSAVSLSGNTVLIGADGDDGQYVSSGSAYVFTRSGTVWTQQAKLSSSRPRPSSGFGSCLSLSGETAVIGAQYEHGVGTSSGAVYVFSRSGTVWHEHAQLIASDSAATDYFGYSVGADLGRVIVGAYRNDDPELDSGAAYVYDLNLETSVGKIWRIYR